MEKHILEMCIQPAIQLCILELQQRGGPTQQDFDEIRDTASLLGEKGDILLFGGGKKGEVPHIFNKTARAIAVLSFVPGGIDIFGCHFESSAKKLDNFQKEDMV